MKVLIVTPSYFPIVGGSETMVRDLSINLNRIGVNVDVLTFSMDKKWKSYFRNSTEQSGSFKVIRVPAVNPFSNFMINPLYNVLRINVFPKLGFKRELQKYDIIHFVGEADLTLPIFSYSIKKPKIMHCVSLQTLHSQYRVSRSRIFRKLFVRVFPRLADLYIVPTPDEITVLLGLGVPKNRILVFPYIVDEEYFRPGRNKKSDNLVLFVGRITKIKGLHVLLDSLAYLNLRAEVVVIGSADDPSYFREIQKKFHEVNEVGFHTVKYLGEIEQKDLLPWYQKATVVVRPDLLRNSGGFTALEALACGTPVIGTGNFVVRDNVNGIIVPSNDPKSLAWAIYRILEDRKLGEEYGRQGRLIVEQYFSWKTSLTKLVRTYQRMLK
jgi:glycosyltransferase involved in cell wall biosynthesis